MMLANDLNLIVPPVEILEIKDQKALLIRRYDRIDDIGAVTRLHQEDFCQAMGLSHELKYEVDDGPGLKDFFDLVRDYSANPIKDVQQLLQWVFFNFLIGNMDAHAKNLSFLYQGRQIRLAMKIGGGGGENRPEWVMARHWECLAADLKISPSVLKKQLSGFCRNAWSTGISCNMAILRVNCRGSVMFSEN